MSFRAQRAEAAAASAALEADLDEYTSRPAYGAALGGLGSAPPPRAAPAARAARPDARHADIIRDEDFRVACGAFVRGRTKAAHKALDLARARELLADGAALNGADADGWTALHWAAADGKLAAVRFLVDPARGDGLDLERRDKDGCTPLWAACFNGEREVALCLLAAGADGMARGRAKRGAPDVACGLAARTQRHPGLADLVDTEMQLRRDDPTRQARLRSGELEADEFKRTLRAATRTPGTQSLAPGAPGGDATMGAS